jgi:hypothetical protein
MSFASVTIRCAAIAAAWLCGAVNAQPAALGDADRAAIEALVASYGGILFGCKAEEFADLFAPEGYFASGFRGHMVGRARLVALVESERHCRAPAGSAAATRPGGANAPAVVLEPTATGARGLVTLGAAEYQDEYVKTAAGWRFASRTVVVAAEKAAGLDASAMLAINALGGPRLGDYYEPDESGVPRLMTSGVRIGVDNGRVTGRAFLREGGYDEQVYEQAGPGQWRIVSSAHVAAAR